MIGEIFTSIVQRNFCRIEGHHATRRETRRVRVNAAEIIEPQPTKPSPEVRGPKTTFRVLAKRDEKEVVLRDGQNKEIILAAKNVEELRPSPRSLMPDRQLAGLTAQEAADLLEYLATRK